MSLKGQEARSLTKEASQLPSNFDTRSFFDDCRHAAAL